MLRRCRERRVGTWRLTLQFVASRTRPQLQVERAALQAVGSLIAEISVFWRDRLHVNSQGSPTFGPNTARSIGIQIPTAVPTTICRNDQESPRQEPPRTQSQSRFHQRHGAELESAFAAPRRVSSTSNSAGGRKSLPSGSVSRAIRTIQLFRRRLTKHIRFVPGTGPGKYHACARSGLRGPDIHVLPTDRRRLTCPRLSATRYRRRSFAT